MSKIKSVKAIEVLDSRGTPTVATTVQTEAGNVATAFAPSGASTGEHEAHELRDHDEARYFGKGVLQAVKNVNEEIASVLLGADVARQLEIDKKMIELDGTSNKEKLGANAILATSLAAAKAAAQDKEVALHHYLHEVAETKKDQTMPIPWFNVINGGRHAQNGLSVQEFHLIPAKAASFSEALRIGAETYHHLGKLLLDLGISGLGDEGGYAGSHSPQLDSTAEALDVIIRACELAGYKPGENIWLGLDVAASEFFDAETEIYKLDGEDLAAADLAERYGLWLAQYPIISMEDPFSQNSWPDWSKFVAEYSQKLQIVGDDLLVTNPKRIQQAIDQKAATAVLVKPNQIGSLSETLSAILLGQEAGFGTTISHRSGETEDTFIADLAVGTAAGQIKTGALARGERTAKFNRLLQIEAKEGFPIADPFYDIV